ncbi:MAG: DUF6291 domain-containing protein [Prevotella sp.]|jgi:hypothetical protein|nr:DUF6291 domain-containing protein [Prevotella sp.]
MADRKSFVFYINWKDSIQDLPDNIRLEIYESIADYAATGQTKELSPMAKLAFNFIKSDIDSAIEKYDRTVERNRKNIRKRWENTDNIPSDTKNTTGISGTPDNSEPAASPEDTDIPPAISATPPKKRSVKKETSPAFHPPAFEQVDTYCKERKNNIDAQLFIDYYTARGWMIGKTKMKDWQAAVRTWEGKQKESGKKYIHPACDYKNDKKTDARF